MNNEWSKAVVMNDINHSPIYEQRTSQGDPLMDLMSMGVNLQDIYLCILSILELTGFNLVEMLLRLLQVIWN